MALFPQSGQIPSLPVISNRASRAEVLFLPAGEGTSAGVLLASAKDFTNHHITLSTFGYGPGLRP